MKFRVDVLARKLLAAQSKELLRLLALVRVFELPVPLEAVQAVAGAMDVRRHLQRAVALGLMEDGVEPGTRAHRYHVSRVLEPLLAEEISEEDRVAACAAGARALHKAWLGGETNGD